MIKNIMKCLLHSGISKPVEKLSMYNCNAILRTTLRQQHCFVNTILKTGIVTFTGGTKMYIFAATLADNPIEITRSDFNISLCIKNIFMPGVGCDNFEIKNIKFVIIFYYLAPGGGYEVLFSPGLSVCLCVCVSVCVCVCVSGQYFGILFLGY